MKAYRPPDRSMYLLTPEIKRLLAAAKEMGEFQWRYLRFMANTGVRPSESNQVRISDVHAEESRVRVITLKQKDASKTLHRDVDLSSDYGKELGRWLSGKPKDSYLFRRSRVTLWGIFKKAAALAGLPKTYKLYSLRHSRAIYLLEWTDDLVYTSRQLGHSSLDVTRVYLHCLPSKREEYVKTKLETL